MAKRLGTFENRSYTSQEHHEWALKLWSRMDRDGSGSITREELNCDEFQDVLHQVIAPENDGDGHRASCARAEMHIQQALDFCLRKASLNKDGSMSFKEFKSLMRTLRNSGDAQNRVHLIWALFDLDGSNTVDKEEFAGIYSFFCGRNPTHVELDTAFEQIDQFDKKSVTKKQFIGWLRTDAPEAFRQHGGGVDDDEKSSASSHSKQKAKAAKVIHRPAPGLYEPRADDAETWTKSWHVQWNDRFRGRDPALMNPTCPERLKHYFSAPQTLPELNRFFDSYKGFSKQQRALNRKEKPRPRPVLSTQSTTLEVNPERAAPGGTARNSKGDLILWDNEWPDKPSDFKNRIAPGSLLLRCQKPPPSLFLGRDEEHIAFKAQRSAPLLKPLTLRPDAPPAHRSNPTF